MGGEAAGPGEDASSIELTGEETEDCSSEISTADVPRLPQDTSKPVEETETVSTHLAAGSSLRKVEEGLQAELQTVPTFKGVLSLGCGTGRPAPRGWREEPPPRLQPILRQLLQQLQGLQTLARQHPFWLHSTLPESFRISACSKAHAALFEEAAALAVLRRQQELRGDVFCEEALETEDAPTERREVLLTLKARAEEKAQGAEVEALLKRLSAAMLGTVAGEDSLGSTSPRWRQLGFQSNDPRSDLRTGLLALDCLVFMAERYPLANSQMIREAQSTGIDYPFAVASINVTQHLARYLHLVRDAVGCALDIASPRTVHRFAGLLQRQEEPIDVTVPFCELHAAVMTRLHCNWRRRKREDPQITVMSFAPVLEETLKSTRRWRLRVMGRP
eukprot:g19002.t1